MENRQIINFLPNDGCIELWVMQQPRTIIPLNNCLKHLTESSWLALEIHVMHYFNLKRKCQALRTSILKQNNIPFHLEDKSPYNHNSMGPSII